MKEYLKYQKYLNKGKMNWFNRIRYWKYLKEDYDNATKDNYKKQNKIKELKIELSQKDVALNLATKQIEELAKKKKLRKNNYKEVKGDD